MFYVLKDSIELHTNIAKEVLGGLCNSMASSFKPVQIHESGAEV